MLPLMAGTLSSAAALASAASPDRIVLITGSNKGIGKEIARAIGSLPDHTAVLACRDAQLGAAAAAELAADGCSVAFSRLDLTDAASIAATRDYVEASFGRLDALVNNAAICFNDPTLYGKVPHTPFEQQARLTVETNYFGSLAVTEAMLPLLRRSRASPRVVNVASAAGRLRGSPAIQRAISDPALTVAALGALMESFVSAAEEGTHLDAGWPNTCYGVSKLGLIALTRVMARDEAATATPDGLAVSFASVDPGFCATDQNNNQGHVPAAQGATTAATLAAAGDQGGGAGMSGRHFYEGREMSWTYGVPLA